MTPISPARRTDAVIETLAGVSHNYSSHRTDLAMNPFADSGPLGPFTMSFGGSDRVIASEDEREKLPSARVLTGSPQKVPAA